MWIITTVGTSIIIQWSVVTTRTCTSTLLYQFPLIGLLSKTCDRIHNNNLIGNFDKSSQSYIMIHNEFGRITRKQKFGPSVEDQYIFRSEANYWVQTPYHTHHIPYIYPPTFKADKITCHSGRP